MTLALASRRTALTPPWVKNDLWRRARAVPSLELRFADNKSLTDAVTGASLVTFTRSSNGTFVDSAGVLQTAATDVPRFDHNPTTGESLGLLVEEQRTNLLQRSEEFDNAIWTKSACSATANSINAPDGAATADFVVENSASAIHRVTLPSISFTASTVYTVSIFAKSTNRNLYINANTAIAARASFNLATGAINVIGAGSAAITAYANGWYRCSVTGTAPSTQTTGGFFQLNTNALAADETYTGDGTSGIYIWGAQLEAGAFPTSYIKNVDTAAGVTRNADVCSITNANLLPWFTSFDEHTFYAELKGESPKTLGGIIMEGLVSGTIGGVSLTINSTATRFRSQQRHGVARFDSGNTLGGTLNNTVNRVALRASALGSQSAENGLLPPLGTVAQADWNTGASIAIGKRSNGSSLFLNGCIARIAYWPQSLANSTLQTLTQ